MKKLYWISTILLLLTLATTANAQRLISIGASGLYGTDSEEMGINGHVILHALPVLDVKAGYNYYFWDVEGLENASYSSFDVDAHYVLLDVKLSRVYAFAGLNFATVSFDNILGTDVSDTNTGVNIGAGGELGLGGVFRIFAEAKMVTGPNNGAVISAGVRFGI